MNERERIAAASYEDELKLCNVVALVEAIRVGAPLRGSEPTTSIRSGASGGLVYFIGCRNFVKIGWSVNPRSRVYSLQTGNPYQLSILGVLDGRATEEALVHRALRKVQHNSEWHRMSDCLERIIYHHTFPYDAPGRDWTIKQERDLQRQLRGAMHLDTTLAPHTQNVVPLKKA